MVKKKSFWRGIGIALLFITLFYAAQSILATPVIIIVLMLNLAKSPELVNRITEIMENENAADLLMREQVYGEMSLWGMLIAEALLVIGIVVFFLIRKKNPLKQLEINKVSPLTLVLSIITGFSLCISVEFALSMLPIPQEMFDSFEGAFEGIYKCPEYLIILAVGIIGPICEEIIFRGGAMNALRRESNPTVAIIISGLVFGIVHGIPLQILYASVIGIILGIVFHSTKSLLSVIIIHIVNNIFSDYIGYIFTGWENPVVVLIVATAVSVLCICLMTVIERKRRYSVEKEEITSEPPVVEQV